MDSQEAQVRSQGPTQDRHRNRRQGEQVCFALRPLSQTFHLLTGGCRSRHNSTDCLFLSKLPPELRNRVYALVLGDRAVHVQRTSMRPLKLQQHICLVAHEQSVSQEQYTQHHKACFQADSRPPLALLRTCRQVHDEASLIPYATTNYIVESWTFTSFMRRLKNQQRKAIKKLSIFGLANRSYWDQLFWPTEIKDFANLTHLSIVAIGNASGAGYGRFKGLEIIARLPMERIAFTLSEEILKDMPAVRARLANNDRLPL